MYGSAVPLTLPELAKVVLAGENIKFLKTGNANMKLAAIPLLPDADGNGQYAVALYDPEFAAYAVDCSFMGGDCTYGSRPSLEGCYQLLTLVARTKYYHKVKKLNCNNPPISSLKISSNLNFISCVLDIPVFLLLHAEQAANFLSSGSSIRSEQHHGYKRRWKHFQLSPSKRSYGFRVWVEKCIEVCLWI